jgi:hypothetical protein
MSEEIPPPMAATTPTVNKAQLASLVRRFRAEKGLTQQQLGDLVFPRLKPRAAVAKIIGLERGTFGIHHAELMTMIEVFGITDPELVALLEQTHANTSQRGRWTGYRSVYSEDFRRAVDLEEDASVIRVVSVESSPDLLGSEVHVRAMFATSFPDPDAQSSQFEAAVAARLARCALLGPDRPDGKPPVTYHAVLSESCLRRIVGNRATMRDWIAHLLKLSAQPNLTLQVIPYTATLEGSDEALSRFTLLKVPVAGIAGDLEFVFTNLAKEPRYIDDKDLVGNYEDLFRIAAGAALSPQETRRFLKEVDRDYR